MTALCVIINLYYLDSGVLGYLPHLIQELGEILGRVIDLNCPTYAISNPACGTEELTLHIMQKSVIRMGYPNILDIAPCAGPVPHRRAQCDPIVRESDYPMVLMQIPPYASCRCKNTKNDKRRIDNPCHIIMSFDMQKDKISANSKRKREPQQAPDERPAVIVFRAVAVLHGSSISCTRWLVNSRVRQRLPRAGLCPCGLAPHYLLIYTVI